MNLLSKLQSIKYKRVVNTCLCACSVLVLTSCSTSIEEYKGTSPAIDIRKYFDGDLIAWGMIADYSNKLTRRFCVELKGTWQGDEGLLEEVFYFQDGEISNRNWQITAQGDGIFTGRAEDVRGEATGRQVGSALQWQYTLLVPIDGTTYEFSMDDWMYQIDERRVFNKAKMNKFGMTAAEITLFFEKTDEPARCKMSV